MSTRSLTSADTMRKSDYMTYLTSYECMVRAQDSEFTNTSAHMKLLFGRIQTLGRCKQPSSDDKGGQKQEEDVPSGMLTYIQIRRCLLRMGIGWNRRVKTNATKNNTVAEYDDDVSVLSFNSTSSFHSGQGSGASGSGVGASVIRGDIIATDAQLIMLLTSLVELEEGYRAFHMNSNTDDDDNSSKNKNKKQQKQQEQQQLLRQGLFLPEFIQCYELIIGGMNSLKSTTRNPTEMDSKSTAKLSNRLKERTMGMLRPYGPDSNIYNNREEAMMMKSGSALSPQKGSFRYSSPSSSKIPYSSPKSSSSGSRQMSKSGFSNKEMRKVLRSKDITLAKIMEEHDEGKILT